MSDNVAGGALVAALFIAVVGIVMGTVLLIAAAFAVSIAAVVCNRIEGRNG